MLPLVGQELFIIVNTDIKKNKNLCLQAFNKVYLLIL